MPSFRGYRALGLAALAANAFAPRAAAHPPQTPLAQNS